MTRRELEVRDPAAILEILDRSRVLHLGLIDEGMPYVVPMNYGYVMENGRLTLYLHSSLNGYKLDVIRKSPTCCFEMECDVMPFPGKVACQFGTSYSSLMGRGQAVIVETPEEKMRALTIFMRTQTGREFEFNERLVSAVSVIRVDVSEYTAKHRPMPVRPTVSEN